MYEATCVVFILVFFMFYCDLYEFGIYNFVFFWIGGICFLGYIRVFSFRGFLSRVILWGGMFSWWGVGEVYFVMWRGLLGISGIV